MGECKREERVLDVVCREVNGVSAGCTVVFAASTLVFRRSKLQSGRIYVEENGCDRELPVIGLEETVVAVEENEGDRAPREGGRVWTRRLACSA